MADNLGLIMQVNYADSQRNIDKAIIKLQEHVSTKKLHIAFDAESIKGLDQISKTISPSINQVNNLNTSFQSLGRTMENVNKQSVIETKNNGILTEIKEIKELENAFGQLTKVTEIFNAKSGSKQINEETINLKRQREAVDALNASKSKMQQSLEPFKINPALITEVQQLSQKIKELDMSNISKTNIQEIRNQITTLTQLAREIDNVKKAEERLAQEQLKQRQLAEQNIQRQQQLYAGLFNQTEKSIQQQANLLNTRMQSALGIGVKVNGLSPESSRVLESQLERYKNIIKQFQGKNELGINIRPEQLTQLQNLENRIKRFYETIRQGQKDSHGFNFTQYDQFTRLNPAITNATHAQQYYNTSLLEGHRLIASNIQQTEQYIRVTQQLRNGSQHLNLGVYIDRATGQMYQFNEALRDGMTRSWGLGEAMSTAATKAMVWSVVMGSMYSFLNILQQIPQAIISINTRLVEMSKVMSSNTYFGELMENTAKSANAYGRTITETQDSLVEFGKQGFEAAQSIEMANSALLGANVTGLKTSEMAGYLTATMAQFNIVAEDSVSIINRINEVDNNFAVTSIGLAQSLSKAGESAQQYGATIDNLIGYTTAIQTATKESGNVIGNSLKTTISRTFSDDSEKILNSVGIAIRDISGEVRTVDQIWSDLAIKYRTLSNEQRQQIGLTIGSRYHLTRFLALMDNWDIATRATTTSQQSLFSALEENRKHLASLESQINKVKSAGQEFAYTLGENGLAVAMGGLLGVTTTFIKGLNELAKLSTTAKISITALSITAIGLTLQITNVVGAIVKLGTAMKLLAVANPWLAVIIGLATVTVGVATYLGKQKQLKEEQDKITETVKKSTKAFNDLNEVMDKIGSPSLQNVNDAEAEIKKFDELISKIAEASQKKDEFYTHDEELGLIQANVSYDPTKLSDEMKDLTTNLGINILQIKTWSEFIEIAKQRQDELNGSLVTGKKNSTEYQAEQIKSSQTQLDMANNTRDLVNEYKELLSVADKNEQQTKRLAEVKNMLLSMFPAESKNGQIIIALLEEESKKRVELAETTMAKSREQLIANVKSQQITYETAVKNMAFYQAEIDMLQELWSARSNNTGSTGNWRIAEDLGMAQSNFVETKKEVNSLSDSISKMNDVLNWKPASVAGIGDKDKKEKSSPTTPLSEFVSIEESLIRSFLTESKITEESNKLLEKQIQIAKSAKDYNSELSLSRQLIEGQSKQISQLSQARSKMEDEFAKVSSEGGYSVRETLSWFDPKGEDTLAYQTKFKNSSVETRKTMGMTHDELQKLEKSYHETGVSIDTLTDSLVAQKNSLIQIEIEKFEQSLSNLDKKMNLSKSIMDLYDKSSEEYAKEQARQITILKEKEDAIFNEIVTIGHLIKATDLTTEAQKALNDEMANLKLTLNQNQKSIQDYANDIVRILKDAAKQQEIIDLAKIETQVKAEDRRHKEIIDNLDAEEKKYEDSINKQISAIDRLANAEDYTKNLDKSQSEAQTIQDQINIYSRDTSAEGRAKLAELQAQLAEKQSEIDDMQDTHTIDLRKQNLQDALDAIKKESEAKKQSENDAYEAKKQSLDDQKTLTETTFNELMLDDQYWLDKVQLILDGNITGIKESLNIFADEFTTTLTTQAGKIDTSFQAIINTIEQIKSAANELDAFPNYASGTSFHKGGLAKTSELGPELIIPPNGRPFLSGNNGPEIMNLEKGTEVVPHNLTEQLISKSKLLNIPSYANGTGINSNGSLTDLIKNLPSILPNISLQQFPTPQLANNISTTTTNNLSPIFNISVPKGTTKSQAKEIVSLVYDDLVKILKK